MEKFDKAPLPEQTESDDPSPPFEERGQLSQVTQISR